MHQYKPNDRIKFKRKVFDNETLTVYNPGVAGIVCEVYDDGCLLMQIERGAGVDVVKVHRDEVLPVYVNLVSRR